MGTVRQKRLARKIPQVINSSEPMTGEQLVASVGYGYHAQRKPGEILNSIGVQEELAKIGFSEEKAKEVVGVILGDASLKPEPRLKAAEIVFKVHGSFAPEKHLNVNVDVSGENERLKNLAEKLNAN